MLDESWLQQEFLIKGAKAVWRRKTVERYLKRANSFLERLLLLVLVLLKRLLVFCGCLLAFGYVVTNYRYRVAFH